MFDAPEGKGDYLATLYKEVSSRVAGCFVADDRTATEVSVHLRGWQHREWSRNESHRKVWLFVQVQIDGRVAHELELGRMLDTPIGLNSLLRLYLCQQSADECKGGEQAEWLCRAVTERLEADARSLVLQAKVA